MADAIFPHTFRNTLYHHSRQGVFTLDFPDSRQALTETVMARQSIKIIIKERGDASLPLKIGD